MNTLTRRWHLARGVPSAILAFNLQSFLFWPCRQVNYVSPSVACPNNCMIPCTLLPGPPGIILLPGASGYHQPCYSLQFAKFPFLTLQTSKLFLCFCCLPKHLHKSTNSVPRRAGYRQPPSTLYRAGAPAYWWPGAPDCAMGRRGQVAWMNGRL